MSDPVRVARVEARLVPHRWVWAEENAAALAAQWERRQARTPAIFNGRILMVASAELSDDVMRATFFATDYMNLLGWMDCGCPDGSVVNGFAMGALRSTDGAYLLGRMADGTANAGKLYFPCGTPDLSDVTPDGRVDLAGSLVREIAEETGFGASDLSVDAPWTVIRTGGLLAFMRLVRLSTDADTARDRMLRHLASEARPELSDIRIVRGPADIDDALMPATVPIFLREAFSTGPV